MAQELNQSLEYTPTWIVAVVCSIIVFISLCAERALHRLGKYLKKKKQTALYEALHKLEEELMLLGFISLLLTVFQGVISDICISPNLTTKMLPCKRPHESSHGSEHDQIYYDTIINRRRLFSTDTGSDHWEGSTVITRITASSSYFYLCIGRCACDEDYRNFFKIHADGHWRRAAVVSWLISFFKQFYGSVTKQDYLALRYGFVKAHFPEKEYFDFHDHMLRTLEFDFKKVVGISWYLWLFVVLFLLLNLEVRLILSLLMKQLLLLVGAKLEHIIARLAQESVAIMAKEGAIERVKPSDEYFWFTRPALVLDLLHFILFQNSFEIAFFFWIWCTYGFDSCIMEKMSYIIPRLIMGVIVQVLCSYSTLPLYTIVTQMGTQPKIYDEMPESSPLIRHKDDSHKRRRNMSHRMTKESTQHPQIDEQAIIMVEDATTSIIELPPMVQAPLERPNASNSYSLTNIH
ncbi:hypothetical protein VNO77_25431 [Canavalia gladiata]|uniref:MLO-like protein n=1 Tax=Canavalia gladiata TaxID=3824 RepID=A0AAN9LBJ1_CANGL